MGLIKSLKTAAVNYFLSNNLDYQLNDYAGWTSAFPQFNQELKEDYRSFAYASINCRAEKVRESSDFLYKKLANKKLKEIEEHPFLDLINTKNILGQTFPQMKYLISVGLDLYGNAFIYVPRKSRTRMPDQFILLPSNRVTVNYNSDYTQIENYTLSSSAGNKTYSKDEIIQIKLPDPNNFFWGKSTVSALRFQIDADYYQSVYNKNFYKNDASLGMVLSAPTKMDDKNYNRLRDQFRDKYAGYGNAGKHLVLDNGMTATRLDSTPREAQYKDSRLDLRDEIFGVFKTNKSILGYTDDVNRSNAESARASFIQNCIRPFGENISDALDTFVKVNYDERLLFKFDYDVQQDATEQRADLEFMAKYGILTKNEIREIKGYSPVADGDTYYSAPTPQNNNQTEEENGN